MGFFGVLLLLLIAGVVGSVAQGITGSTRRGCLVSIAIGFVGALLGTWLARLADLPDILSISIGDTRFPVIWAILGSVIFVVVVGLFTRSHAKK